MKIPIALALTVLLAAVGGGYFLEDRYQTIASASESHARLVSAQQADVADMALAQAITAAELTRDIEAIRLQNVIAELEAIESRQRAQRALPSDNVRKAQLLTQMDEIIRKLEK